MLNKSVYIWSQDFTNYSNSFLVNYLHQQDIVKVLLALKIDNKRLIAKVKDFLSLSKNNHIDTCLMTGNNYLVFNNRKCKLNRFIAIASKMLPVSGIHLDVEPHAFNDWQYNKDVYTRKYLTMVENAFNLAERNNLELTVSIPLIYQAHVMKQIYRNTHKVYLMVYEQKNVKRIKRDIDDKVKADKQNSVISLRPIDFNNREDFENFMIELYQETSIDDFAIHDIGDLSNLL